VDKFEEELVTVIRRGVLGLQGDDDGRKDYADLFIYLIVMTASSPEAMALLKNSTMFGERKSEQPSGHVFLPHEQVQNAKNTAVSSAAESRSNSLLHDGLPVLSPSCGHGGLEGGFLCRKDKPSWLRQISTSEVGDRGGELQVVRKRSLWSGALRELFLRSLLKSSPSFPTPADRLPLRMGRSY
jgi:hypothetical protein